jgi:hypothetical protein
MTGSLDDASKHIDRRTALGRIVAAGVPAAPDGLEV